MKTKWPHIVNPWPTQTSYRIWQNLLKLAMHWIISFCFFFSNTCIISIFGIYNQWRNFVIDSFSKPSYRCWVQVLQMYNNSSKTFFSCMSMCQCLIFHQPEVLETINFLTYQLIFFFSNFACEIIFFILWAGIRKISWLLKRSNLSSFWNFFCIIQNFSVHDSHRALTNKNLEYFVWQYTYS